MNKHFDFMKKALSKDRRVSTIKLWGVKFNKIYKQMEEEMMIANKNTIVRAIFLEKDKQTIENELFETCLYLRKTQENLYLFDDIFLSIHSKYYSLMQKLRNSVANGVLIG